MEKTFRKKKSRNYIVGEAHIKSTYNNIIITLTNKKGDVIAWSSAGKMGFKGSKKNTPYAAQITAEDVAEKALNAGIKKLKVIVRGPGAGRDAAIRALVNKNLILLVIKDITPIPHNGCRPPKKRRI
ncbi:SSU ribosomal protein S11p (S14e) [Candidatus Karelsulcia muelleri]|uniref:Small ribosomal subunit protein uS11 n=1 Tax=Candidatus Karelsulcia muelleri TaxID=336810 RepID=A0A654M405_9FLAO|nr:30S ribosomal protein S11 [Candidatus Karelsulcia muelleri]AGS33466.1 30S ribosomal protein S11 (S14e) [Candidatus Karelsulcia muelleri str. Sulcia-ALF]AIZ48941.1 30S ribosomal subunit protein S11 (S14e) [Candidatus Karelsulcia muelleri]ALP70206.1 SSU ribosomal protein S11p (S14e) [Candidatus Karelsulcia muelleri]QND78452.1 SSU ribosomal protein S11 [Candidatus Karelsulcia muelleri]